MPTPDATVYGDNRTVRGHAVLTSKVRELQIETAKAAFEFAAKVCEREAELGIDDERAYNGKLMAEAIRALAA